MDESNKSVGWVAGMLALTVAYFGWGFMAADYFQNDPARDQVGLGSGQSPLLRSPISPQC